MRLFALVAGLVILLVTVTGAAAFWVARPILFSGVDWDPAHVTVGTMVEPDHPGITRREIVELLRGGEYETLTRILATRRLRAMADPKEEWEFGRVVDAFEIRDDSLADEFDEWATASPRSFAPRLASARYRLTMAYFERGQKTTRETPRAQLEGMEAQLALLFDDANAALQLEPQLSEAYVTLIDAARTGGAQAECGNFAKAGLAVMPASFRIRAALAVCRLPRWGGHYVLVDWIADAADPFGAGNPELITLHGYVEWDRGRDDNGAAAIARFTKALQSGAHWRFYADRAYEYRKAKRYQEALDDTDAALALAPDRPELLIGRIHDLAGLERDDEIPEIIELVEAIDPLNKDLPSLKEYMAKVDAYETRGDARTYYERGRGYLQSGDHDKALADFEAAIRVDPSYFNAYVNIDYIYAQRRDWPKVIAMWDGYLEKYPDDGKAVFERAGAIRHSGDQILAVQEANRACKMGVEPACQAVRVP